MSLTPQVFFPCPTPPGRVRHLFLPAPEGDTSVRYVPKLYFEAKIDLADIRSGYRDTASVNEALELLVLEAGDTVWTRDMARRIDPARIVSAEPRGAILAELPSFVDAAYLGRMETLFLSYVMRHHSVSVFRNYPLQVYSEPGETLHDFRNRCLYLLGEAFRRELDALHETFVRRLEQVREKYRLGNRAATFDDDGLDSLLGSRMHEVSERIADLFLETELVAEGGLAAARRDDGRGFEFDQRLMDLQAEARQAIAALLGSYQEKLRSIDEYALHPTFKDIHLVRSALLWVPEGKGRDDP